MITNNIVPEVTKDHDHINYWMPNVGYNQLTKKYVMIYWSSRYGFQNSVVALAVSSTPYGPFVNVPPLTMQGGKVISDTINLFIDDDNTAYVRYNTRDAPLRHLVEGEVRVQKAVRVQDSRWKRQYTHTHSKNQAMVNPY